MESDDIRMMFDSNYLGAWDLEGQDRTVTITGVEGGELTAEGNRKSRKPILHIKEHAKGIVLNKTNMKTIHSLLGSFKAKDWVGKQIIVYPTKCMFGSEEKDCIRVRPRHPGKPAAAKGGKQEPAEPGSNG